eukprot:g5495.t1
MGNTSASQKDISASAPRAAKDLNDLLPALRERFEELAGLSAATSAVAAPAAAAAPAESRADEAFRAQRRKQQQQQLQEGSAVALPIGAAAVAAAAAAAGGGGRDGREQKERFVMFDDCWSELPGPRGAQVAKRLYGVLDANGDGKLDFEEFASAACLLKDSPDEDKLALLFRMYGDGDGTDGSRAAFVGRRGLMAFILDVIAASPPLLAPPDLVDFTDNGGGKTSLSSASSSVSPQQREHGRVDAAASGATAQPTVDLEQALEGVLAKMAGVVLAEYDADNDGLLIEKEWRAYVKREEESVSTFLNTLSHSVEKLLLP